LAEDRSSILKFRVADRQFGLARKCQVILKNIRRTTGDVCDIIGQPSGTNRRTVTEGFNMRQIAAEFENLPLQGDRKQNRICVCRDRQDGGRKNRNFVY